MPALPATLGADLGSWVEVLLQDLAISFARFSEAPWFSAPTLMCLYWRSRSGLDRAGVTDALLASAVVDNAGHPGELFSGACFCTPGYPQCTRKTCRSRHE